MTRDVAVTVIRVWALAIPLVVAFALLEFAR
jgi:hypothetical protein